MSGADNESEAVPSAPLNRMGMAVAALAGILISTYMLLYKLGVIRTLVCGTGNCEVVQSSKWSDFLGVPVPLWGVVGYGLVLVASLLGVQPDRAGDRRIAFVLATAATLAFLFSLYLSVIEEFVIGAWCRWCISSAVVATALFLLSLPEFRRLRAR
ncbi:MAG: vitamin K epoxide reductase family protein [Gemmatimonadota bacterium]